MKNFRVNVYNALNELVAFGEGLNLKGAKALAEIYKNEGYVNVVIEEYV